MMKKSGINFIDHPLAKERGRYKIIKGKQADNACVTWYHPWPESVLGLQYTSHFLHLYDIGCKVFCSAQKQLGTMLTDNSAVWATSIRHYELIRYNKFCQWYRKNTLLLQVGYGLHSWNTYIETVLPVKVFVSKQLHPNLINFNLNKKMFLSSSNRSKLTGGYCNHNRSKSYMTVYS